MKKADPISIVFAAAGLCFALSPAPVPGQTPAADAKAKALAETAAKRNALFFENNATVITFYDRSGKAAGRVGERALYDETVLSPDRTRVAVIKDDRANKSADLWVLDVATGGSTRITTSAKGDLVSAPVWSPDGSQLAYVAMRAGQEAVYLRASNGQGPEGLLYKNPGAFLNLSDWSLDGRFLSFAKSDFSGGVLYILTVKGNSEPLEIFRSNLELSDPRFSPDGRFLSYSLMDEANRSEVFVRPVDSTAGAGPWQISEGSLSAAFWRRDGKELYYVGPDRSVMVTETSTSSTFTFTKPKVLFRPPGRVPDLVKYISADAERFLALPPSRGPQLQQLTVFDREGRVVKKVGEPGLYFQPAFSPDATRLAVLKKDFSVGGFFGREIWVFEIATGKTTRVTNDTPLKRDPLWSPDGSHILYVSEIGKDDWGVYRRAADGTGGAELLFRNEPHAFLNLTDISPDGKLLVCESGNVILVVPLTGSDPLTRKPIEYLREESDDAVGRLSPDGRFMAYWSNEAQPERGEVYVRSYDASTGAAGDAKWQVSEDGVEGRPFHTNGMLSWRVDGKEFFFRGLDLDSNDLRVMVANVDTNPTFRAGKARLLFSLPGPLDDNLGNISRDGQRFVFAINVPAGYDER